METVLVVLRDEDGRANEAEVVPRAEAEKIIRAQRAEKVARIAYRAAFATIAGSVVGQAVLDLKTGEVGEGGYVEGDAADRPGEGHLVPLIECDQEAGVFRDYTKLSLLSEEERAELEARLRAERGVGAGEAFDLRERVGGGDPVVRYLKEKGVSVEQREEDVFARVSAAEPWPDWDEIGARLDRIYGEAALRGDEAGEREGAGEVAARLEAYGSRLGGRERQVLEAYYGIGGGAPATYSRISRDLGVSIEQVRQTRLRAERRVGFGPEGGAEVLGLRWERERLTRDREDTERELEEVRERLAASDRRLADLDSDPLMAEVMRR